MANRVISDKIHLSGIREIHNYDVEFLQKIVEDLVTPVLLIMIAGIENPESFMKF